MTFWRAFWVAYRTLLALMLCVVLAHCLATGNRPRDEAFYIALFGAPVTAGVAAWGETRSRA